MSVPDPNASPPSRRRAALMPVMLGMSLLLGWGCALKAQPPATLGISPSGHYITYGDRTLLIVGDSGTQCVMQNANLNHREWIDDCAARGIRGVHLWAFVAPRQKQDGSVLENRWGYVYPGITPWPRKTGGPNATDQLKQWDLQNFDEGPEGQLDRYWPRLRDLCQYARDRQMVVGITIFFGWPKWNTAGRPDWSYHPLNVVNGGPVTDTGSMVTEVQMIDTPGTEVWPQPWSDAWPARKKTQWIWERLCKKYIDELHGYGNVFFVFMDEHSYSEGNGGDHFMNFFRSRGAVWVDWNARRSGVSWVMSDTLHSVDKNSNAVSGFLGNPVRPYIHLEGPPYMGDEVRTSIWSFAIGGGHFFFHADESQETERTGIMGYDPAVVGGNKGMYKRDWVGHASRFFNEQVLEIDSLRPANTLSSSGTCCLADPGREYVVYSKIGSPVAFTVNLSDTGKRLTGRFFNPRTGQASPPFERTGGTTEPFSKPDTNDWILHLVVIPGQPGDFDGDGDVDLTDFSHLQLCFTGAGEPVTDPACKSADLDGDGDVDGMDVTVFRNCLSGPQVPADPECAI